MAIATVTISWDYWSADDPTVSTKIYFTSNNISKWCSRTVMTAGRSPTNVLGVDPSVIPEVLITDAPDRVGSSQPNLLHALVQRNQELLNPSGPIDDSVEWLSTTTATESTPAVLLMSTDEFGTPSIVGSVSFMSKLNS